MEIISDCSETSQNFYRQFPDNIDVDTCLRLFEVCIIVKRADYDNLFFFLILRASCVLLTILIF